MIVGIVVSRPFWGAAEAPEDDATRRDVSRVTGEKEPEATLPLPKAESETLPSEPIPVPPNSSAGVPEPIPVPPDSSAGVPEPIPVPPDSSASPLQPWGPLPETGEDFKKEAFEAARRLTEAYPQNADALGLMGNTLNMYGNTDEAVKWWNQCLQKDPNRAKEWRMLGSVADKKGQFEEAVRLMRKAEQLDPTLPDLYQSLATALLKMGEPQQAAAALEKAIKTAPRQYELHVLLGQTYRQLKEYEKAAEHYLKATEIAPRDSAAFFGLANAYTRLGQKDKAAEYLKKFKDRRDEESQALSQGREKAHDVWDGTTLLVETHTKVGLAYQEHGNLREAQRHWQRATDLDPQETFCRNRLFDLHVQGGRPREALKFCQKLRELEPDNYVHHLNAGSLLTQLQQFEAAEEALNRTIEIAPDRPLGYRSLTLFFFGREGRIHEAKAAARKLVELERTAANCFLLCEVSYKAGDPAGALAAIKLAIELDPDNQRYKRVYSQLQAEQ